MPITAPIQSGQLSAPEYHYIVHAYDLTMLKESADFSLENGDLALTKDGDVKIGDNAYNGLFRLVQTWRYNVQHLRYLFETMKEMLSGVQRAKQEINSLTVARSARLVRGDAPDVGFGAFTAALLPVFDDKRIASLGAATYGGCLILVLRVCETIRNSTFSRVLSP
jgi:hypothetical protein